MKKILILLITLISLSNFLYAWDDLQKNVDSQIQTFYQDLMDKYNKWEIKKEKIFENLRNKIYILKEIYWDKLPDTYYDEKLKLADKIDEIWSKTETIKTDNTNTTTQLQTTNTTKQETLSKKTQTQIDTVLNWLFKKLENKTMDQQTEKYEKIISKIDTQLEKIKDNKNSVKIKLILEYLKSSLQSKLDWLKWN